ncbi:NAD(P)-dependent oxidoreductase [Arthrobacter pigmenti]
MSGVDRPIGVVGLGNLGLPIARRLSSVGAEVIGYDISSASRKAAEGIQLADSVSQLAETTDLIFVLVSDAMQSAEVIFGEEGITSAANPPRTIVLMATIGPDAVADLAASLTGTGPALIDVPVSGGASAALVGQLALMVGGAVEDVDACLEVLNHLGQVHLLGGVGAGQTAKLANQIASFGAQAALQEAVALADAQGVDRQSLLGALSAGTADSWVVRHWGFFDETARAYDAAGVDPAHRPWHKDLATATKVAQHRDLDVPVTELIARIFGDRVDQNVRRN